MLLGIAHHYPITATRLEKAILYFSLLEKKIDIFVAIINILCGNIFLASVSPVCNSEKQSKIFLLRKKFWEMIQL